MQVPYVLNDPKNEKWRKMKSFLEGVIEYLVQKNIDLSDTGSKGGYLSYILVSNLHAYIRDPNAMPTTKYVIACGSFEKEKWYEYFSISQEKAFRLYYNLDKGHKTSFESEDPSKEEYGGAIHNEERQPQFIKIFSFSGLKASWDQMLSIAADCFEVFGNKNELDLITGRFKRFSDSLGVNSETTEVMLEAVVYALNKKY